MPRARWAAVLVCPLFLVRADVVAAHGSAPAYRLSSSGEDTPARARSGPETPARFVRDVVVLEDDGTMIEDGRFVASRVLPVFCAAVPDSFDFVGLFGASSFAGEMYPDAATYRVRSHVTGLGRQPGYNRNGPLGIHTKRLRAVLFMNDVRHYGPTPRSPIPRFPVDFTGVELFGSEMMHAFGVWVDLAASPLGARLQGREDHWSLYVDTDASVMQGCRWRDNGDGSFTSVAVLDGFSELDEYLMGLRSPEDVGPMFLIEDPAPDPGAAKLPRPGITVLGRRVDFTIQDVVAAHGVRAPAAASAPHRFRAAFVLVVPAGTDPPRADIAFLERFRVDWETWFREETEGLGTMDTTIPRIPPVAGFEADRIAGNVPTTVRFRDRSTGTVEGRTWDFGDGTVSGATNPVHTYDAPGVYDVSLAVAGPAGTDTLTREGLVTVAGFRFVVLDDFEAPSGWTVGPPDDAGRGRWERGDPEGTTIFGIHAQPEDAASGSCCWSTGLAAGDYLGEWDVDGGTTALLSPVFDLAGVDDPFVAYARWYCNDLGIGADEDELVVEASSDGGATWLPLETVTRSETEWQRTQFRLVEHLAPTEKVRFRFLASDRGTGSLVEAAVDVFEILGRSAPTAAEPPAGPPERLSVAPNPFAGRTAIRWRLPRDGRVRIVVYDVGGRAVRVLEDRAWPAGPGTAHWNGRDAAGRPVGSGVYTVRIEAGGVATTRKIVRVR